jgi:hypothetical protein
MEQESIVRICGLKFKRQCPLNWNALGPIADDSSRHCDTCDRSVFLCTSDAETMFHAERGDCIARSVPTASELPKIVMGEPDVEWLRANQPTAPQQEALQRKQRERNIDDALNNLRFTAVRCAACGYPVPSWWDACRVCGTARLHAAKLT